MQSKSRVTESKRLPLPTLQLLSSPTVRKEVHDELAITEPGKGTPCPFDFFLLTLLPLEIGLGGTRWSCHIRPLLHPRDSA